MHLFNMTRVQIHECYKKVTYKNYLSSHNFDLLGADNFLAQYLQNYTS